MTTQTRLAKRVLLVGWDGADWNTAENLISAKGLPNLAALLRSGAFGPLAASPPRILEAQWTSMVTGQRAHKHGVLHASQPLPSNRGVCRVTRPKIRTATLGAILSASELITHQISWPVSHPAENLRGVAVSDHFATEARRASIEKSGGWPWVTPPAAAGELFARRCSPADIEEVALAQLTPASLIVGPARDPLQRLCRLALAETLTVFRAAKWCMDTAPWDCTLCAFPMLRRLRQSLQMLPAESRTDEVQAAAIEGCYEYLDMLLGQLVASAGEHATIAVASMGHVGAVSPACVLNGPSILSGSLPQRASVLDVTPTLLTLLGVPVASDMDGRIWSEILPHDATSEVHAVDTWRTCIFSPADDSSEPESEVSAPPDPAVDHLMALGYVDPLETAAQTKAEQCRQETLRNRALSLLDGAQVEEAIEVLRDLQARQPLWPLPYELLAEVFLQRGQCDLAATELQFLVHHGAESARLYLMLGKLALAKRDTADALRHLHVADHIAANLHGLRLAQATALVRRRDFPAAQEAFRASQQTDGPSAVAWDGLAVCSLALGQFDQAAESALAALEQDMHFARAHYHLGIALVELGRLDDARRVLESSAAIDPQFVAPWRWLARLSRDYLHDHRQAEAYRARGRQVIRDRRQASDRAVGNA